MIVVVLILGVCVNFTLASNSCRPLFRVKLSLECSSTKKWSGIRRNESPTLRKVKIYSWSINTSSTKRSCLPNSTAVLCWTTRNTRYGRKYVAHSTRETLTRSERLKKLERGGRIWFVTPRKRLCSLSAHTRNKVSIWLLVFYHPASQVLHEVGRFEF